MVKVFDCCCCKQHLNIEKINEDKSKNFVNWHFDQIILSPTQNDLVKMPN